MRVNEELNILIQSKYPVIFFETIDELHTIRQLKATAEQLRLIFYHWSLTDGLRRGDNEGAFYQTKSPTMMLRMIIDLIKTRKDEIEVIEFQPDENRVQPGLFVLKDFNKYLEEAVVLRLFKDLINQAKNTKNTFVILSPEYKIPKDIEADTAHLIGGFPAEQEIQTVIMQTVAELILTHRKAELKFNPEELKKVTTSLKGLSIQQIRNVINQCVLDDNILNISDLPTIETYKKKVFDQEGLLEFYLTEDKNDLAGFNNLKRWLGERKESFSSMRRQHRLPLPKGLLLIGVQGCGKSLAIKVIAREFNLPLYRLDLSKLYSKYVGETEQNLRKALAIVEKLSPLCLWIDEIEKCFAASRGDVDGGVSQRILGTFLTWMQERKAACFVAATANDVYRLPPEFLRKGRFDEIFFVDLPDAQAREHLFKIHLQKRDLKPKAFAVQELVATSDGFSGAEIEQALISALYRASSVKESISTEHILAEIKSTKPLSVLKREEISTLRTWAKERTIPA